MAFHNFLPDTIFKVVLLVWIAVKLGLPLHPFLGCGRKKEPFAKHIIELQEWNEETGSFEYKELGVVEENCEVMIEPDIEVSCNAHLLLIDERVAHAD